MHTVNVRVATAADQESAIGAMVLAFVCDPPTRWIYPDPHHYLAHVPAFVRAFGGRAFTHGSAYVAGEYAGVALWLPPGVHPDDAALDALFERTVPLRKRQVASRLFEEMARFHPTEPHWYLPLLGVDPNDQGRGYGSALLRVALERIDREGRLTYLENTNPANAPLYERHGFEVLGTIQIDDAPPLRPMLRRPRESVNI